MKSRLKLSFLGPFQALLDGQKVVGFKSNKVRGLLAYLAVEADRPHSREALASLLWPDWSDREALSNLRFALSNLRQAIGDQGAEPPFLLINRDTLQFNTASSYRLDVTDFIQTVRCDKAHPAATDQFQKAVAWYQGSFLEGFSIDDSVPFEEWVMLTREDLRRQMSDALLFLAECYQQRGDYEAARGYARRQLELEPWDEAAHQLLMRALALGGQRSAALAQYQACRRSLADELQVEPSEPTTRLFEQIRDGKLSAAAPVDTRPPGVPARLPAFLSTEHMAVESPVFVARQRELGRLEGMLELALTGQGRLAFVTGEAGSGKSALLQEFARQAQKRHVDLCAAGGNCNAYTGHGDPYLPFREMLELLSGDVGAKVAAGAITQEAARRLWLLIPQAVKALLDHGPDLVDTFVRREPLLERAASYERSAGSGEWLARLDEFLERKSVTTPVHNNPQQLNLFDQYSRVLQALAQVRPLLLILDDLQWVDPGSISLLFHLGRHLGGSRILVLGAYRPEEVASGREGGRHPLETVINEFRRDFGDICMDLEQAENWDFLQALLDSEPNCLGADFRAMLYRQTHGLPLFTIELLRGMQERGDLKKDEAGRWIEASGLNWERMPERVEAVFAERIGRLAPRLQSILRAACVEGELFIAEGIARVLEVEERQILGCLSGELERTHRLIQAHSILRVDGQRLSRYRFQHFLFQKYLYSNLDKVERVNLHEQAGLALEGLYTARGEGAPVADIALQLARHFQEAGITEKAIHYFHQAGDRAVRLSDYQQGIAHLTRAQDLLMTLPASAERDEKELALQVSLGIAWMWNIMSHKRENSIKRARELCQRTGKSDELCWVIAEWSIFHYVRGEYRKALELSREALSLSQKSLNPLYTIISHWSLGFIHFVLGEFQPARAYLEQVISAYEPQNHHREFVTLRGSDFGAAALAYYACCLWCLGYPDQASKYSRQALDLARELNHAFTSADVLCFGGCLFNSMRRDAMELKANAVELIRLSEEIVISWLGVGTCYWGEALTKLGELQEGKEQIRRGLAVRYSEGDMCSLTGIYGALGEAQAKGGQLEDGLATLAEAYSLMEKTDERYFEAELHRLRAELLLLKGDPEGAEASFQHAIQVAHTQQAKSWELRAALSLGRLWLSQGRIDAARQTLSEIYGWFSEGFDTPDLMEARSLLEEVSG